MTEPARGNNILIYVPLRLPGQISGTYKACNKCRLSFQITAQSPEEVAATVRGPYGHSWVLLPHTLGEQVLAWCRPRSCRKQGTDESEIAELLSARLGSCSDHAPNHAERGGRPAIALEHPNLLPAHNSEYLEAAYWEKRFKQVCGDDAPMLLSGSAPAAAVPGGPCLSRTPRTAPVPQPLHLGMSGLWCDRT